MCRFLIKIAVVHIVAKPQLGLFMFDFLVGEGLDDDGGTLGAVVQNFWLVAGKAIIKEEFLGEEK